MSLARPNNYELRIMHYEFPCLSPQLRIIRASTRVRPYEQIQFLRCISPQLRIMNYELNQYSIAMVDFVLYDLGCKASEFLSLWFEINV